MDVLPTPGSPRNTSLYLNLKGNEQDKYFSKGAIRGAPPSAELIASLAALISRNEQRTIVFLFPINQSRGKLMNSLSRIE